MTPVWVSPADGEVYAAIHKGIEVGIGGELDKGTAMAVIGNGAVMGAALFNNYHPNEGVIELHAAAPSPRWLSRRILLELFRYPFEQMGCQAVVMRADADNPRVRSVAAPYGFKEYIIPRLRGRNKSEAIYVLSDDDWRKNGFHKEFSNG